MTNRELLAAPRGRLDATDRRRLLALRAMLSPMPCAACLRPLNPLTASGTDLDDYRSDSPPESYHCPACGAVLERVVPLVAVNTGWHWRVNHLWLADRLRKAELYDLEHPEGAA